MRLTREQQCGKCCCDVGQTLSDYYFTKSQWRNHSARTLSRQYTKHYGSGSPITPRLSTLGPVWIAMNDQYSTQAKNLTIKRGCRGATMIWSIQQTSQMLGHREKWWVSQPRTNSTKRELVRWQVTQIKSARLERMLPCWRLGSLLEPTQTEHTSRARQLPKWFQEESKNMQKRCASARSLSSCHTHRGFNFGITETWCSRHDANWSYPAPVHSLIGCKCPFSSSRICNHWALCSGVPSLAASSNELLLVFWQ